MQSPFSHNDRGHFWVWAMAFVPFSIAIHFAGLVLLPPRFSSSLAQNRPVEVEIVHVVPPPKAEPEPPPEEPEPPKPPPPRPPPKVPVKPPPNQKPPPPNEKAEQPPDKPVPIVAGVSLSSTTESGTFSAPVGNTSYGAMQGPAAKPEDVKPYSSGKAGGTAAYALPGEVDTEPAVLSEFKPPYPEAARKAGIEGTVRLRLWLDAQGKVQQVRVQRKAGYGLDEAAAEAIVRFKFRPAKKKGKPVPINFTFDFHFYLD